MNKSQINFDKIIFLENGQIVESGTHEELIHANGAYTKLFKEKS